MKNNMIKIFFYSLKELSKRTNMIFLSLILWVILNLLSLASKRINILFSTNIQFSIWIVVFFLVYIAVLSFFSSELISLSITKNKFTNFKNTWKKFFLKNLIIMILISLITLIISQITFYSSMFIGKTLSLSLITAQIVFFLIYFALLAGFLIFFTFSSFFVVIENASIKESIKKSFKFVKNNYPETLLLMIFLFIIFFLLNKSPRILAELIEYVLLIPLSITFIKNFLLERK